MQEPIEVKLRDHGQIALARLQDTIVESIVEIEPDVVFHGGTAIWRCYNGNRFSEDVDLYATDKQVKRLDLGITWSLSKRGAKMEYPVYTDRVVEITGEDARSKFEAMTPPKGIRPIQMEYTRADGSKLLINTLSAHDFIAEKVSTYGKRRYVRDLYDIYHLVMLERPDTGTKALLKRFINEVEKPIDEGKLKDLVYVGIAPSYGTMVSTIGKAVK
ncbi:protein containing DUF1814 [mine drainage metagenome]|uniref:Protein containing DUF1814 n=1 Tax=mine drainage metagenome TaxID=410659 RepID=T1B727_9ZZZZ